MFKYAHENHIDVTSIQVTVKKDVFLKIKEYIGLSDEEVSQLNINLNDEEINVTISKLRKISNRFAIPISVFFLSSPPEFPPRPRSRKFTGKLSRKLKDAIREAYHVQEVFQELGGVTKFEFPKIPRKISPKEAAKKIIGQMDIPKIRRETKDRNEFFKKLRQKFEEFGILVLQFSLEELRGFTISMGTPYVIVVNKNESEGSRTFTLFHELGHLLIGESILDDFTSEENAVEYWCEEFAACVLIPENITINTGTNDIFKEIRTLSNQLKISKHATAVALLKKKIIDWEIYNQFLERYNDRFKKQRNNRKGGPQRSKVIISEFGDTFVSTVANAYHNEKVSDIDAAEIFGTSHTVWQKILDLV